MVWFPAYGKPYRLVSDISGILEGYLYASFVRRFPLIGSGDTDVYDTFTVIFKIVGGITKRSRTYHATAGMGPGGGGTQIIFGRDMPLGK